MHENWIETDATVATVDTRQTRGGDIYIVVFTYKVNGEWCGGTFTTGEEYDVGDTLSVRYDPANPDRNNLVERETISHWILGAVLTAAALIFLYAVFLH